MKAQVLVPFTQRTSQATPAIALYNIKGDFTMLGNTNLTLVSYSDTRNNESRDMEYVDIDGDPNTLNSSMATLEISNSGENSADQNCSTVLFAGLYWTGKSDDNNETFSVTKNSVTKNYNKNEISIMGPGASTYSLITALPNADIRFPGALNSGIFIGYQEITDYVQTYGPGAYTVADIALKEGTNSNPGLSGGWAMVVIYENPIMKSRAVTFFDGYAYVNGQLNSGTSYQGDSGNIDISGFTTVGAGTVNMKLGVMAAEGDVGTPTGNNDYLAVQKLTADNTLPYNATNYLTLNHTNNTITNFFNSSIYPVPTAGNSYPNLQNNTGIDISMFTIPNTGNVVIGNNQTATTFRYGSTYEVYTIFGLAMSVDAYVPELGGIIGVSSINGVPSPPVLTVLPGEVIEYTLDITNMGTEATTNTVLTIPIPTTSLFETGSISSNIYSPLATLNTPYFDAITNEIKWDIGDLPIVEGNPDFVLGDLTFQLKITEDCAILINSGCTTEISLETGTLTGIGSVSGLPFTGYFFQGYDSSSGCDIKIDGSIVVAIDTSSSTCFTNFAGPDEIVSCGGESVTLGATAGTIGVWSIISGPSGSGEIFSDSTSPSSDFYSINTGVYTLRWTIDGCAATNDDVVVTLENCNTIDFDGDDDNINLKNTYNLNSGSFSIETWIKSNATSGDIQAIISKRFGSSLLDGYDLRLVNNVISFNWNNGNSITSTSLISCDRWYHIAVTFNGTTYNLYIDGVAVQVPVSGSNPILNNNVDCIVGAMDQNNASPVNYCNGWIDEIRIWNVELTVDQIRQMMNQEIESNGTHVKGSIIPVDISDLLWSNLDGYYQMDQINDINNGYLLDKSTSVVNGKLNNIYSPQQDTAPLPYVSAIGGDWDLNTTWLNGAVQSIPNTMGIDGVTKMDWNIVETNHNINTTRNVKVLGLISNANELSINADNSLDISHYLLLNGVIDLDGESQLIQTEGSVLDENSIGYIEKDQQGTANSFNYNYWSSSVGPIGAGSNNANYSLSGILEDGTNAAIPNENGVINFQSSYSAADTGVTSPIILSSYWLFTFNGTSGDYNSWVSIDENTPLKVGDGYTMKGTSGNLPITTNQNYVFKGKPNNGDITLPISVGNNRLIGNPYASAIDANEFIKDNIKESDGGSVGNTSNVFNGALYFWHHFGEENSHNLAEYVGGYATYTLIGGTEAISNDILINNDMSLGCKEPERYIPVGQGFFVNAYLPSSIVGTTTTVDGGDIIFKNSQRIFQTEISNGGNGSVFFKSGSTKNRSLVENSIDTREKIRLVFDSSTGYHRQLLIGVDENASNGFDMGYDAPIADINKEDMYWTFDDAKFVIQGVSNFDIDQELPLGIIVSEASEIKIQIDTLENVAENTTLYIKDNLNGETYDITHNSFDINLEDGEYLDRFALTFQPSIALELEDVTQADGIFIYMNNHTDELQIKRIVDSEIIGISVLNLIGQTIESWKGNFNEREFSIPLRKAPGVYIVSLITTNGFVNKKIIIE